MLISLFVLNSPPIIWTRSNVSLTQDPFFSWETGKLFQLAQEKAVLSLLEVTFIWTQLFACLSNSGISEQLSGCWEAHLGSGRLFITPQITSCNWQPRITQPKMAFCIHPSFAADFERDQKSPVYFPSLSNLMLHPWGCRYHHHHFSGKNWRPWRFSDRPKVTPRSWWQRRGRTQTGWSPRPLVSTRPCCLSEFPLQFQLNIMFFFTSCLKQSNSCHFPLLRPAGGISGGWSYLGWSGWERFRIKEPSKRKIFTKLQKGCLDFTAFPDFLMTSCVRGKTAWEGEYGD